MNRWLGNCLPVSDWERRVFVGPVANAGGNKEMARRLVYRIEDGEVLDALLMQQLDESPPRTALLVL
jgi:hypothetical protein